MLNQAFPPAAVQATGSGYVLPAALAAAALAANESFTVGAELRLHPVYGDELWRKLRSLGLGERFDWAGSDVIDVSAGGGLLSYHLLQRVTPRTLTLLDISDGEVEAARALLEAQPTACPITYVTADATRTGLPDARFDVVLGNSFLHHFPDLPAALRELRRLVRPGGSFATLHEPTPAAPALETGSRRETLRMVLQGDRYAERQRYRGEGIAPGGGADIWLLPARDLRRLLLGADFTRVTVQPWHLVRPYATARRGLHLTSARPTLTEAEAAVLRRASAVDAVTRHLLPARLFGSCAASGVR